MACTIRPCRSCKTPTRRLQGENSDHVTGRSGRIPSLLVRLASGDPVHSLCPDSPGAAREAPSRSAQRPRAHGHWASRSCAAACRCCKRARGPQRLADQMWSMRSPGSCGRRGCGSPTSSRTSGLIKQPEGVHQTSATRRWNWARSSGVPMDLPARRLGRDVAVFGRHGEVAHQHQVWMRLQLAASQSRSASSQRIL